MPLGVPSCVAQKLRTIQLRNRLLCVNSYFLFLETRATPPITATATATPAIGSASPVFGEEVEAAAAFLVVVAAGVADEVLVQVSYAIGVARPINIYVNTYGRSNVALTDGEIAKKVDEIFDMRPRAIEERLKLRNPIYSETAAYGHMGREPQIVTKHFESAYEGNKDVEVELFTWEKLDYVDKVKEAFGLK